MYTKQLPSILGRILALSAFVPGCSRTLPPHFEDGSQAARIEPFNNEPEPSFAGLSVQSLMEQPALAPHVTSFWTEVRQRPGCLGDQGLERGLERALYRDFLATGPSQPGRIVQGLVRCLLDAGASSNEALDTVDAAIARGLFTNKDLEGALLATKQLRVHFLHSSADVEGSQFSTFASRAPHSRPSAELDVSSDQTGRADQTKLPIGGIGIGWISSDGDPFNFDSEAYRGSDIPDYPLVHKDGEHFLAPLCHISVHEGPEGKEGPPRSIRVSGIREIWSETEPNIPISSEKFLVEELVKYRKDSFVFLPVTRNALQGRLAESFVTRIAFEIYEEVEGQPPASYANEVWARLDPVQTQELSGFKVTALGPQGRKLPYPEVVNPTILSIHGEVILSKEELQMRTQRARDEREHRESLIGSRLTKLEMAHTPEAKAATSLDIPQTGRAVVIAGASWCGPCRALDPSVKEYMQNVKTVGSTTKVLKVSIEDDRVSAGTVSDPAFTEEFPSGVLSAQQQKDLSINRVPWFFIVEEGKIIKQGTLSAEEVRLLEIDLP